MQGDFNIESFQKLNERIDRLKEDQLISNKNCGLIYLFLTHRLFRDQYEIEEAYTDGGNDCGIDAVYIDRQTGQPVVHLFQSKVHDSERKARNPFKISSVEKCLRIFEILKDRSCDLDKNVNPRLKQKILEIRDLQDRDFPEFKLWLISNGRSCSDHELQPLVKGLGRQDIYVDQFHLNHFVEFCINAHSSRSSHTFFAREAGVIEFGSSELRNFVGYISARQLYELIRDLRDERKIDYALFDMNVRGFLGSHNPVNKEIFKTAASSEKRHFASLNNGITMVGTVCKVMKTATEIPKVGVKRLSIVNGAQTCSAIFDAMKDYYPDISSFDDLSVLFRIFETDDPDLINRISVSTNTQNRILSRDLKVNDRIQIDLERDLAEKGIVYIRKRGVVAQHEQSGKRFLDALRAGQLIMSYILHDPSRAKRESDGIFSDFYDKIFNNVSRDQLVEALDWFDLIEKRRQYIEDEIRIRGVIRTENTFVTYGAFHILMLCSLMGGGCAPDRRDFVIDQAINLIAKQLKLLNNPAYYTFFRDPRSAEKLKNSVGQLDLFL